MLEQIQALLANPEVYPVELTLTSGGKVRIPHPDFAFYSRKMEGIVFYPRDDEGIFELIVPQQISKIRAKIKKSARRSSIS